jgi:ABC-type glycerol-3-phosphate transport system permease component
MKFRRFLIYLIIITLVILVLTPIFWMVSGSLKTIADYAKVPPEIWPSDPTLFNYKAIFNLADFSEFATEFNLPFTEASLFLSGIKNSVIVAFPTMIVGVFLCSLAGYGFAKFEFRGKNAIFLIILFLVMVPSTSTVIPNFILMSRLGLINTYWALILPLLTPPFGIFWMRQYIGRSINDSIIESARLDGCSEFSIFLRLVLPISAPGIAFLAIWLFLASWNNLLLPLVYITEMDKYTFNVILRNVSQAPYLKPLTLLMAGSLVSSVPMVIVFLFAQRQFLSGITMGSVRE